MGGGSVSFIITIAFLDRTVGYEIGDNTDPGSSVNLE